MQPRRSSRRARTCLICAALLMPIAPASAGADCVPITALVSLAQDNFATLPTDPIQIEGMDGAGACTLLTLQQGRRMYHCGWRFGFRADRADTAFDSLNRLARRCLDGSVQSTADAGVNHPDSYRQHLHSRADAVLRVSIKDKGATGETLVFFGVEGISPD